jgi:hypothetical protein
MVVVGGMVIGEMVKNNPQNNSTNTRKMKDMIRIRDEIIGIYTEYYNYLD